MKKIKFFAAALGLLTFAACSNSDDVFTGSEDLAAEALQDNAITFGTYMGQQAQTRAISGAVNGGVTGSITNAQLLAQKRGFGVFAYYTQNEDYAGSVTGVTPPTVLNTSNVAQTTAIKPNFMWNQHIEGTDAETPVWSYSPVKYWPNGNNPADDQADPAEGTGGGKLSFFAYAPYVATVGSTGITAFSSSSVAGNPTLTYKMPATGDVVDLLWGTAGTNGYKAQNGTESQTGNYVAVTPASPKWADRPMLVNTNLTKMKTEGKVDFAFKHALAKVGGSENTGLAGSGLQIVLDVDGAAGAESGGTYDNNTTKVTVSAINIKARSKVDTDDNGTADKYLTAAGNKGVLDLATGQWTIDKTGGNVTDDADKAEMTHNITNAGTAPDGLLAANIKEPTSAPAKTEEGWNGLPEGVLTTKKPVYANETNPLVFIPGTYPELEVSITYIVRTKDTNLADKYSEVSQTVKKTITFAQLVELNKQYNLLIHLGLTSVKFTASVSDWDAYDANGNGTLDAADYKEIYLPINVQ